MPVVLLAVAAVILGGVAVVALGRGGELAEFPADVPPFDADVATAADVALLRPPSALWGYNVQATDDALARIALTVTERDVEIATLRTRLAELQAAEAARAAPAPHTPLWQPRPWSAWDRPNRAGADGATLAGPAVPPSADQAEPGEHR